MDWLLAGPQIKSVFSSIGSMEGGTYIINPNALALLEEINCKLIYEDQTLRTFRRAIGFGQNVRSDLIPLLENTKDDNILDAVIRILVNLTVPVECLFSVDVMYRTEVGRLTIFELNKLLYSSKEAFTDPKSTKSVVEYMKHILESDSKLSLQKCDSINNCLLLLRNILHIPETNVNFMITLPHSQTIRPHGVSMQNTILWNLFIQSIDKLLLYLITCPQRAAWGVTIVQLISLIYKDQHVSTLQKLLNLWFEASLSESSEDNESNTSPPKQGSGDSSPMLTSDPTSDSSDNGGGKSECSEERRQVLREDTEATLQEVSRKGQEYKNLVLMGVPAPFTVSGLAPRVNGIDRMDNYLNEMSTSNTATALAIAIAASATARKVVNLLSTYDQLMDTNEVSETLLNQTIDELDEDKEEDDDDTEKLTLSGDAENSQNENKSAETVSCTTAKSNKTPVDGLPFKTPPLLSEKTPSTETMDSGNYEYEICANQSRKMPHSGKLSLTTGISCPQKRECPSSQSELSDCGYGTQVENQESVSTSSDDGPQCTPQHQKPPCNSKPRTKQRTILTTVDTKELRRKKLVKRSKSSLINMKGLVQRAPTDEDISNILKEFTVDFLLKGYDILVGDIHSQLLTNVQIHIDSSHFFWLVTYFLKFAVQLELDMEHINSILTYNLISFLTYEGVSLCEQLELNSRQEGSDLKPYLRRMHLVVTAIREFLQAIETYKKVTHLSAEDREQLRQLQIQISSSEDLRCLFVLLLRRYNPSLHTKLYLQDLVITNHILLLLLDDTNKTVDEVNITILDHISQFATLEVMAYYGMLLEDFSSNGPFVNECILTMMHHVVGDLGQISTLFQPVILKVFSRLWESDYELCDDWSDLIEYVIHKFINSPQKSPLIIPTTSLTELTKEHNLETSLRLFILKVFNGISKRCISSSLSVSCFHNLIAEMISARVNGQQDATTYTAWTEMNEHTWTREEMDTLYWYYVQSKKSGDVVGKIIELFNKNGNKEKSRICIIQQLLQQDIITLVEYDDLMKFEDAEYQRTLFTTPSSASTESGVDLKNSTTSGKPSDDIQILRDLIVKENKEKHLVWLQKILLECCYVKLVFAEKPNREDQTDLEYIMEPMAYHCIMKHKPIPVVQWNNDQAVTMMYQPFVLLLHKLGFQLPADAGSIYARIPDYWNAETMFCLAKKLGPLDNVHFKFDATQFKDMSQCNSCNHIARASLTSMSSLDVDSIDTHEMVSQGEDEKDPEKCQQGNPNFAVPRVRSNSGIQFTTEAILPKWLQLVMRNKCSMPNPSEEYHESHQSIDKYDTDVRMYSSHVQSDAMTTETPITESATQATGSRTTAKHVIGLSESVGYMCANTTAAHTAVTDAETVTAKGITAVAYGNHKSQQPTAGDEDGAAKWLDRRDSNSSGVHTQSTLMEHEYSAMVDAACKLERSNSETSIASNLTRMYVSDEEERHEMSIFHSY